MFNLHSLRVLLAAAMLGEGAQITAQANTRGISRRASKFGTYNVFTGAFTPRSRGKRYPEQSSRQRMRAFRRQQGGPGIALDPNTHKYVPREG